MKKIDAIKYYGSVRKLAIALGFSTQYIYKLDDELPQPIAERLQGITDGKLKANGKGHGKSISPATRRKRDS